MRALPWSLVLFLLAVSPVRAVPSPWAQLPSGLPADSLVNALRTMEARGPRPAAAAAAYALGQLHHARGEYRPAAEAFGRAAARFSGPDRAEARYRQGLAWLGAQEPGRARASFEEVAAASRPLRAFAQLGLAHAHALAGEPAREKTVLERLLASPAGEAEPAALERYAQVSDRLHRESDARTARERLLQRWPRSFEAAREGRPATRTRP